MDLQFLSLVSSAVIVLLCTWAVLTHRVDTNSLSILILGTICIGAALGVHEAWYGLEQVKLSSVMIRCALAIGGIAFVVTTEVPHLIAFIRKFNQHTKVKQ